VTAFTSTSLLVLEAQDLHALMDRDLRIAERIREVARSRINRELVSPKGDILAEEIEEKPRSEVQRELPCDCTRANGGGFYLVDQQEKQQYQNRFPKSALRS
jgi:hypothetical protein